MAYLKLLILSFICIFSVHSYSEIDLPYNEEANARLELSNALHSAKVNNRYLLLEFGGNKQKMSVEQIFNSCGLQTNFLKDLQGDWRVVEVRR